VGDIVGGRTSLDQPLDINFNKQFKTISKRESINHTNSLLKYFEETNSLSQNNKQNVDDNRLVQGILVLIVFHIF